MTSELRGFGTDMGEGVEKPRKFSGRHLWMKFPFSNLIGHKHGTLNIQLQSVEDGIQSLSFGWRFSCRQCMRFAYSPLAAVRGWYFYLRRSRAGLVFVRLIFSDVSKASQNSHSNHWKGPYAQQRPWITNPQRSIDLWRPKRPKKAKKAKKAVDIWIFGD